MQEKDLTIQSLRRDNLILKSHLESDSGEELSRKLADFEQIESGFQGNLDIIKQLTSQNNELLSALLEAPQTAGKKRTHSLGKTLQKMHQDTSDIDEELCSLQAEIADGIKTPERHSLV